MIVVSPMWLEGAQIRTKFLKQFCTLQFIFRTFKNSESFTLLISSQKSIQGNCQKCRDLCRLNFTGELIQPNPTLIQERKYTSIYTSIYKCIYKYIQIYKYTSIQIYKYTREETRSNLMCNNQKIIKSLLTIAIKTHVFQLYLMTQEIFVMLKEKKQDKNYISK